MAKLYFRYGTVAAGKSLDLLKIAYNYEENNMKVIILTSKIDNRYGNDIVKSRVGISKSAISISKDDNIFSIIENKLLDNISCILVDEVQFFSKEHIFQLSDIVDKLNIPVICYGLRNDYKMEQFSTSSLLLTIADEIEEIKTICSICGKKKSTINAKFNDNKIVFDGPQIEIGGNEKYKPLCRKCYKQLKK